jgi:hypothetical protein
MAIAPVQAQEKAAEKDVAWAVSQAPADTYVVVSVRSLQELETNLKALVGPEAESMALVKTIDQEVAMDGALDAAGPVVLIAVGPDKSPNPIIMMQIKDGAKFVGEKVEGDILALQGPGPDAPKKFGLKMGAWAAVSHKVEGLKTLAAAPARLTLAAADREAIAAHLVWVRVNPKSVGALARGNLPAQMPGQPGGPDIAKILDWALGLLDQVQGITLTGDVKAESATVAVDIELVDNSPLQVIAAAALPLEVFKGQLPATDRLMVAAWARMDFTKAVPSLKGLAKPLMDILMANADEAAKKSFDEIWAMYDQMSAAMGNEFAVSLEPAAPGQGMYRMAEVFAVKDAAKYRELAAKMMPGTQNLMNGMFGKMGGMGVGGPSIKMDMSYKEKAETVEGLPIDVMTMKPVVEMPEGTPPAVKAQMEEMMSGTYGPQGMVMRLGVLDKMAVVAMGDAAMMTQAIKTARGQAPDLTTNAKVSAAIARLPKGASMAVFISVPNYAYSIIGMVNGMMLRMAPPEVRAALEKDVPPLAAPAMADLVTISGRVTGKTVRIELTVPQSEIRGAIDVFKQGTERMKLIQQKQMQAMQKKMPEQEVGPDATVTPVAPPAEKVRPAPPMDSNDDK